MPCKSKRIRCEDDSMLLWTAGVHHRSTSRKQKCTREVLLFKLLARIWKVRGIMRFVLGRVFGGIRKEDIDPFIGDDKNSIRV